MLETQSHGDGPPGAEEWEGSAGGLPSSEKNKARERDMPQSLCRCLSERLSVYSRDRESLRGCPILNDLSCITVSSVRAFRISHFALTFISCKDHKKLFTDFTRRQNLTPHSTRSIHYTNPRAANILEITLYPIGCDGLAATLRHRR